MNVYVNNNCHKFTTDIRHSHIKFYYSERKNLFALFSMVIKSSSFYKKFKSFVYKLQVYVANFSIFFIYLVTLAISLITFS